METPTTKEVALFNSCLRAIPEDGIDFFGIAKATGMRHGDVILTLDLLEQDGVIFSFGRMSHRFYKIKRDARPANPWRDERESWCEQCDCYHQATAACVDEVR